MRWPFVLLSLATFFLPGRLDSGESAVMMPARLRYVCDVKTFSFLHVPGDATEVHDASGGIPLLVDVGAQQVSVDQELCDRLPWTGPVKVKPATWKRRTAESVVNCTFPRRLQFWVQKTAAGYTVHLGFAGSAHALSRHSASPLVSWRPAVCSRSP